MPIIKKRQKNHDKIVLLAKTELNTIDVLFSRVLIDSYFSHNTFFLVNNVLRKYSKMKEAIKNRTII